MVMEAGVGAGLTVSVTELLPLPVELCAVLTPEAEFVLEPTVVLVMAKITVQLPFAGITIPEKLRLV